MMFRVFTMMQRVTQLIFLDFQVNEIMYSRLYIVCKRPFTNVVMKINYKDGVLVVSIRDKNVEEEF
jgi:hypothetical protein